LSSTSPRVRAGLAALAAGLFVLAALWVPVNRRPVPRGYFDTSWFEAFQPRGLMGTLAAAFRLTPEQFVRLNLIAEVVFLFLLLLALARSGGWSPASWRHWLGLAFFAILLSYHQLLFFGHFLSGFIDIHSATLTLCAVHLLAFGTGPPRPLALALAAALSSLSLLNHERSFLDAVVLATWLWLRFGPKVAAAYFAPVVGSLVLFFLPFSSQARMGMSLPQYWANLEKVTLYVRQESGSLVGIFYGGGFAWLLWSYAAWRLLGAGDDRGRWRLKAVVFVAVSLGSCLAPLLIAHDTNRLVGLMWLPTLLMVTAIGLPRLLAESRSLLRLVAVLTLLQLALPPLFIYKYDAVPLNCYAQKVVRAVCAQEPGQEWTALGGWLRLYEDGGHRPWYQKRCWPTRLFRR
jgi:hypothetical protein